VYKAKHKIKISNYYAASQVTTEDFRALRESFFRAFDALSPGVYYRLESVLAHLAYPANNPLNIGLPAQEVAVWLSFRPIPTDEEERAKVCRDVLLTMMVRRLFPLGCLRLAVDHDGGLCVARLPALDVYFGREGAKLELAGGKPEETKVVVQPDFSVIVIGLNPAPAAELAPFCERTNKNAGAGAIVLKLSRSSVIKAVSHGLSADEVIGRLKHFANNEVPANVLHDVTAWCGWVRRVQPETLILLRCGDRETGDRVSSAVGKQGERLNETTVAIPRASFSATLRAKLQAQGILAEKGDSTATPKRPKAKKKRRAW